METRLKQASSDVAVCEDELPKVSFIKIKQLIFILYFAGLLLAAPFTVQSFDTYYYWDWSKHLALSYYDGSPMIAYFIKLATLVFGDTRFALNFLGIATTALISWILYRTARLFLSEEASFIAVLLWLFSPLVTMDLLKQTTYDAPLTLFWASTIYFAIKFIKYNQVKDIYWIGVSIGLMMLSKYSGFVLILALFIFMLSSKFRYLFKTQHLYCALVLALVIFSPVLIWNYQHDWLSFNYQLSTHNLKNQGYPWHNRLTALITVFLPALNFMMLPILLCWYNQIRKTKNIELASVASSDLSIETSGWIIALCKTVCLTTFFFYLYIAHKSQIREAWLAPYLLTSALLAGFCYQNYQYYKTAWICIFGYFLISLAILINSIPALNLILSPKIAYYHLVQQLNAKFSLPETLFTSGWLEARKLFFLNNRHEVYTLGCGLAQNQYIEWSSAIMEKIKAKSLSEVTFLAEYDQSPCLAQYFDKCDLIEKLNYKDSPYQLYAYKCTNLKSQA